MQPIVGHPFTQSIENIKPVEMSKVWSLQHHVHCPKTRHVFTCDSGSRPCIDIDFLDMRRRNLCNETQSEATDRCP